MHRWLSIDTAWSIPPDRSGFSHAPATAPWVCAPAPCLWCKPRLKPCLLPTSTSPHNLSAFLTLQPQNTSASQLSSTSADGILAVLTLSDWTPNNTIEMKKRCTGATKKHWNGNLRTWRFCPEYSSSSQQIPPRNNRPTKKLHMDQLETEHTSSALILSTTWAPTTSQAYKS